MPVEASGAGSPRALVARVEGIVQGVGFRYSAAQTARALGLKGYVRNLPDGCVEVVAEGENARLERLRAWLEKGPPGAYVRHLETRYAPARGTYRSFTIEF
jgi:acylphosphatase